MIETRGLTKRYGSFLAVDGINLTIPRGEIYGFLGPNGAGKTSTIMMLLGIVRPTAGEIRLFGEAYTPGRLDLRRRIGVVPEKHPRGVWHWMSAEDYLGLFADLFEVPDSAARIHMLLSRVDLAAVRRRRIRDFSRGMLQKLSIIRALLSDPDILFLDEPISGLDPLGIKQVRDLIISENREGRTIFISSHQLSEMEKICHRVAIIFQGRLMAEDSMTSLISRISPDRQIHIELEAVPAGLLEKLRGLPFVREASTDANTVVVKISKEGDYRKMLAELLIRDGIVALSLAEKVPSLEDAFMTITQENVATFTGGRTA
ncbi:MAG: ABC transporter ATP-binding protein [Spirochaetia bacterium]|jgi:ABC-2 type transport system ATP-binding protein